MKRKILIIVENQSVPFDARVWKEALSLHENGYDVTVLCPHRKGLKFGFEEKDGIRIYRHPKCTEGTSALGYLWEYSCALFWEFLYASWIYLRHGFQIIQGCNPPDDIFLIALPFKLLGVKYIFDHHDADPELYISKYGKKGILYEILLLLERFTYQSSDVVMATNDSYRDLAIRRGRVAPEDVFIVRNGPDTKVFKRVPCNPSLKRGKSFLVGYVGYMSVQEGLDILLDVALHIKRLGRSDIQFICVGGGPELPALRKLMADKGLEDTFHFTGIISDQELLDILSTADVCVNPDRPSVMNDISTMIKIMEYMALGKPIVQFDVREGRFSAQEASLYADKTNPVEDFAAKILWLLDRPDERKRMGDFGRMRVEERLAWKYSVRQLLAAYERAFSKRGKGSQRSTTMNLQGTHQVNPRMREPDVFAASREYTNILLDYYRSSVVPKTVLPSGNQANRDGFFRFGQELICYGQCASGVASDVIGSSAFDATHSLKIADSAIRLPFDIGAVIENLRRERYAKSFHSGERPLAHSELVRKAYYAVREYLPVRIRRYLQRAYFKGWQNLPLPRWPVDFTVDSLHEEFLRMTMIAQGLERVPFIWFWPEGATSCLILTRDVETVAGLRFSSSLMDIDSAYGFRSSFQVVPEDRYQVPESFADEIRARGFEFNIHDLNHDGHLFEEKEEFLRRAKKINEYARHFKARGFRSGAMYRNQDWFNALDFSYDMSVPNSAHLEPQRGGCCTVMPYFVGDMVELPLTTAQDYTLFHILDDHSIDLWKRQMDLIRDRNGLISFISHPDYLIGRRERRTFECLLAHLRTAVEANRIWAALPGAVDEWWRARSKMKLVCEGAQWKIEGPWNERARLAYAYLDGERVVYSVEGNRLIE